MAAPFVMAAPLIWLLDGGARLRLPISARSMPCTGSRLYAITTTDPAYLRAERRIT